MAGAVLVVGLLTMTLNNCWCAPEQWLGRLALVCVIGASFALDLVWGRLLRSAFAISVGVPVGWLIFTDNASVAPLFLLLMVGWTVYTGSLRDGTLATLLAIVGILGYV